MHLFYSQGVLAWIKNFGYYIVSWIKINSWLLPGTCFLDVFFFFFFSEDFFGVVSFTYLGCFVYCQYNLYKNSQAVKKCGPPQSQGEKKK